MVLMRAAVFASQLSLALDNAAAYAQLAEQVDELVRTRDQLIQAEKCALAGRLAGCVAHEINTPLTYVLANLEALQDYSTTVGSRAAAARPPCYPVSGTNIHPIGGVFSNVPSWMFWRAGTSCSARGRDQLVSR